MQELLFALWLFADDLPQRSGLFKVLLGDGSCESGDMARPILVGRHLNTFARTDGTKL